MFKKQKRFISLALTIVITLYIFLPYVLGSTVYAQEASAEPTTEASPSTEPTTAPDPTPEETVAPSASPDVSPTPEEVQATPLATATPTPAPTIPPYWSDDYDAYKAQKEAAEVLQHQQEDARNQREDEWDANKHNPDWVAAHGGDRSYYVSGNWQKDQDAKKAAEEAAAAEAAKQAQEQQAAAAAAAAAEAITVPASESVVPVTNDPCTASVGSADALADAAGSADFGVSNNNCLSADNTGTAAGISGENTQTLNDGSTNMAAGNSSANGTMVNTGNVNTTNTTGAGAGTTTATTGDTLANDSSGESLTLGVTAENLNTGDDTDNTAQVTTSEALAVDNTNEAYLNNDLNVQGTSGADVITENDGDATLTTGDVELIANMLNILNVNITGEDFMHLIVNIFGSLNSDLDIDSIASALGLKSTADLQVIANNESTTTTNSETTDIDNNNNAVVNNTMNVDGVSGLNNVSGNDGNADVVTGRVKILANLMNFINANFSGEKWSFIMVNIFGKLTGDIILPDTKNYTDGAGNGSALAENTNPDGSAAESMATSSDTTDVSNTNNINLNNDISTNGISGDNSQNGNEDPGTTSTGGVDVMTKLMNYLNFNVTGNNWVFLVVNVFGKWMGQIVNFAGGNMTAPTDGSFAALSVGNPSGGTSTVGTTVSNTSDTDVNNNNSATVNNDMNIDGVSGLNTLNKNDGSTSLTTGWVEINANLLNIINMNITGRNWMVVFLNIFGDFTGNLFFGPKPVPAVTPEVASNLNSQPKADQSLADNSQSSSGSSSSGNQSSSVVTAGGILMSGGKKRIIRKVAPVPQVLSYTGYSVGNNAATPVSQDMYFTIFGLRIRIPNIFVKIFSQLASGKYLLLARA